MRIAALLIGPGVPRHGFVGLVAATHPRACLIALPHDRLVTLVTPPDRRPPQRHHGGHARWILVRTKLERRRPRGGSRWYATRGRRVLHRSARVPPLAQPSRQAGAQPRARAGPTSLEHGVVGVARPWDLCAARAVRRRVDHADVRGHTRSRLDLRAPGNVGAHWSRRGIDTGRRRLSGRAFRRAVVQRRRGRHAATLHRRSRQIVARNGIATSTPR